MTKYQLLEKLIKEDKISFEEMLILLDKVETPIEPLPYLLPIRPLNPVYPPWPPHTVYCGNNPNITNGTIPSPGSLL